VGSGAFENLFDNMVLQRGSKPLEVVEKLRSMGFKPLRGYHDHVYDWGRKVELTEVLQLANKVHETLKGMKVLYKLETE